MMDRADDGQRAHSMKDRAGDGWEALSVMNKELFTTSLSDACTIMCKDNSRASSVAAHKPVAHKPAALNFSCCSQAWRCNSLA
eukprot:409026-Pelagomonas_calceolata.AAC.4